MDLTTATDPTGGSPPTLFGPTHLGVATFTASGRVILASTDGRPDVADRRILMAYSGRYEFDGTTLTAYLDVATDQALLALPQVRRVEFLDPDIIVLSPPAGFMGPSGVRREYTWSRIR
jgi:hypothetical protein